MKLFAIRSSVSSVGTTWQKTILKWLRGPVVGNFLGLSLLLASISFADDWTYNPEVPLENGAYENIVDFDGGSELKINVDTDAKITFGQTDGSMFGMHSVAGEIDLSSITDLELTGMGTIIFGDGAGEDPQSWTVGKGGALNVADGTVFQLGGNGTSGGDGLLKITGGSAVFGGSVYIGGEGDTSDGQGTIELEGGSLRLKDNVSLTLRNGANENYGKFTLGSEGELILGLDTEISAHTIELGGTLIFDLSKAGNSAETTNLKLSDNAELIISGLIIDISTKLKDDGTYRLIAGEDGIFSTLDISDVSVTYYGVSINDTRLADSALSVENDNKNLDLNVLGTKNGILKWNNASEDSKWNMSSSNWEGTVGENEAEKFLQGDAVVFKGDGDTSAEAVKIEIDSRGVVIGAIGENPGMEIQGGNWVFTGGKIEGGNIVFTNPDYTSGGDLLSASISFDGRLLQQRIDVLSGVDASVGVESGKILYFSKLESEGNGGAISTKSESNLSIVGGGSIYFQENKSDDLGGAIYLAGNGSILADGGNIHFEDNKDGSDKNNAIYIEKTSDGEQKLTLAAKDGKSILFYDPIASSDGTEGLLIEINPDEEHTGTVVFYGGGSDVTGNTTVGYGNFMLFHGSVYGGEKNESFTLGGNATLYVDPENNKIVAKEIVLEDGATIFADMGAAKSVGEFDGGSTNLVLDGNLTVKSDGKFVVNVINVGSKDGIFTVLDTDADDLDGKFVGKFGGDTEYTKRNDRYGDAEYLKSESGKVQIEVSGTDKARDATWEGGVDGTWDETSELWSLSGDDTASKYFKMGDKAIFEDYDNSFIYDRNIKVGGEGTMVVDGLEIKDGYDNWTFSGNAIDGSGSEFKMDGKGSVQFTNSTVFDKYLINSGTLYETSGINLKGDVVIGGGASFVTSSNSKIEGALSFEAGSYVYIDLAGSDDKNSLVSASGTIDLASGMTIVVGNSGYFNEGETFDGAIVQSDEGLSLDGSAFVNTEYTVNEEDNKIVVNNGGKEFTIQGAANDPSLILTGAGVKDNELWLNAVATGDIRLPEYLNPNQWSVVESLKGAEIGSYANQLYAYLATLSETEQEQFLNQLSPSLGSAMSLSSQTSVNTLNNLFFRQLTHSNNPNSTSRSLYSRNNSNSDILTMLGQRRARYTNPWYGWLETFGDMETRKGKSGGIRGLSSDTYGFGFGMDRSWTREFRLGIGFSGAFGDFNSSDRLAKGESENFFVSLYGSYGLKNWLLGFNLGYMYSDYETERLVGSWVNGQHYGHSYVGAFELSRTFSTPYMNIVPYIGFQAINLKEDGYWEKFSGGNFMYTHKKNSESYLQTLGLRFSFDAIYGLSRSNTSVSFGWTHDYGSGGATSTSQYAGGTAFVTRGLGKIKDRGEFNLKHEWYLNDRFSIYGSYTGAYGSGLELHSINAGVRFGY